MVKVFPIWKRVDDCMRSLFLNVGEDRDVFMLKENEGVLEIEVSKVGDHFCVFSVFVEKFLGWYKFIAIHSSSPDDVDRYH